jgi:FAD/FMN-containing dehydrogenase
LTQSAGDTLRRELISIVGDRHVLVDPDLTRPYEYDWTGRFGARAHLVVRPQSTAEVALVVSSCHAAGVAIVPQGGNTGLVGGGVPRGGEVLLSLRRVQNLAPVDNARGLVQVGAGVTLGTLQHHARQAGFDAALDLGARDSATIGGLVACDAGGARALRYGTARARVVGLEAVLADGSIIQRLDGLTKDNAGYDVPSLLIGSEGTLAVITEVLWKLEAPLQRAVAALIPLTDAHGAASLVGALRSAAPSLDACELLTDAALTMVLAQQRRRSPVPDAPLYALVELVGNHDPLDELATTLELAGIEDAAIADDSASRQQLWRLREGITDAVAAAGIPHKIDVGVPLATLPEFLERLEPVVHDVVGDARTVVFGHLGDGNLHVNVLGLSADDHRVEDAVLGLALSCGGTISSEHGVGVAKAAWLVAARGESDVNAMRALKQALDPSGSSTREWSLPRVNAPLQRS